ncbi:MAG: PEP-CTERM sorting domain-containing protein, partial [Phycisphaeraceae bacterium]|nr:PEP-CTERM sorting domain-containing protein [Phycisphaeraceae bacterium]
GSLVSQRRRVAGAVAGAGGWAGGDAVSMAQIPAPGALALLGIAGLGARRRRSN